MNIVAIVQARMGSIRLPGKVMENIDGKSMLARVVQRARRARSLGGLIVATTTEPSDDVIIGECENLHVPIFRGSEGDVLDRYYRAAMHYEAEVVVRITADCPLLGPEIIDQVVEEFLADHQLDYASNRLLPRTFPRGQEVDVVTFKALERAWREDSNPAWREHVVPYITQHPEWFRLWAVTNRGADYSSMRWTVDTSEDLDFVRCIYEHFDQDCFSWHEVVALLSIHPELWEINRHVVQKELSNV